MYYYCTRCDSVYYPHEVDEELVCEICGSLLVLCNEDGDLI